jgi:NAD(P)-dependent dehydrogenase (short-subunit alcohol dehydrogenase family)
MLIMAVWFITGASRGIGAEIGEDAESWRDESIVTAHDDVT